MDGICNYQFPANSMRSPSVRIVETGQHLAKLWSKVQLHLFNWTV